MRASLLCVVQDGTLPADGTLPRVAMPTTIEWPVGDSGTIEIEVQGENGEPFDLTGGAVTLACREHLSDPIPAFTKSATITATPEGGTPPGTATVALLAANTSGMKAGVLHWYDVRFARGTDAWHVLPMSQWIPSAAIARAGDSP